MVDLAPNPSSSGKVFIHFKCFAFFRKYNLSLFFMSDDWQSGTHYIVVVERYIYMGLTAYSSKLPLDGDV